MQLRGEIAASAESFGGLLDTSRRDQKIEVHLMAKERIVAKVRYEGETLQRGGGYIEGTKDIIDALRFPEKILRARRVAGLSLAQRVAPLLADLESDIVVLQLFQERKRKPALVHPV